jgi:hypothetical protein
MVVPTGAPNLSKIRSLMLEKIRPSSSFKGNSMVLPIAGRGHSGGLIVNFGNIYFFPFNYHYFC